MLGKLLQRQSLLTGLLMVDLSLQPNTPEKLYGLSTNLDEIPTLTSRLDQVTARLEQLPIEDMVNDFGATVASLKALVSSPDLQRLVGTTSATMESLNRTLVAIQRLETHIENQALLAHTGQTLDAVQQAADKTGAAMDHVGQLTAENSATLKSLRDSLGEVGAAARSLRELSGRDSTTVWQLEQTAHELENTALSLRQLSDTVERKPDVLIWGRRNTSQAANDHATLTPTTPQPEHP